MSDLLHSHQAQPLGTPADQSPLPRFLYRQNSECSDEIFLPELLYRRLVHMNVLQPKVAVEVKNEQVALELDFLDQYLNGYIFSKYMIALKKLVKDKENQDLNFSFPKLLQLQPVTETQLQNWTVIQQQLDKCGITIDDETMKQIESKKQGAVARLFQRIERFIKITCGQKFLTQLTEEPIPNVFDELRLSQMQESVIEEIESSEFSDNKNAEKERLIKRFKSKAIEVGQKEQAKAMLAQATTQNKKSDDFTQIQLQSQSPVRSLWSDRNRQHSRKVTEGVNISEIDVDCDLDKCENTLELILVTLSRAFELLPQQAAALLANANQFLITACTRGVNGGHFSCVIEWYQSMQENHKVLAELLIAEQAEYRDVQSLQKVLGTLACGMQSQSLKVITMSLELLISIFQLTNTEDAMQEVTLGWFLSTEQGCLMLALQGLKQQSELASHVVRVCNLFCVVPEQLIFMYRHELQNHCRSQLEYTSVVADLLQPLKEAKGADQLINCGLVEYLVDVGAREAENDGLHSVEERLSALTLLKEVWVLFRAQLSQVYQETIIYMIRKELREPCQLKQVLICQVFGLLELFAAEKLSAAPALYKCLVQNLCEEHNLMVRETYIYNFIQLHRENQSIPISILAEPFVKAQITLRGTTTPLELQLLTLFSQHKKLTVDVVSGMLSLLMRVFFTDLCLIQISGRLMLSLLGRFIYDSQVYQQGQDFALQCVNTLVEIEILQNQRPSTQKQRRSASQKLLAILPQKEDQVLTQYRKQAVFLMLQRLQGFAEYSLFLKSSLAEGNKKLIGIAMTAVDQLLALYQEQPEREIVPQIITPSEPMLLPITQQLPPRVPPKTTVINKARVKQDILRIKQTKQDRVLKLIEQEKQQLRRQARKKEQLRSAIEYRRQLLGVPHSQSALQLQPPKMIEYQHESASQQHQFVQLVDLNDLEAFETIDVLLFTRQRKKLFKSLWQKYAIRRQKQNQLQSQFHTTAQMSIADVVKMLRDLNVQTLKLAQVKQLMRQITGVGESAQTLDFNQFKYFVVQAAIASYVTTEEPIQKLQRFFSIFESSDWYEPTTILQKREYKLAENLKAFIPESTIIVTEVVDQILSELTGVHFLEPFCVTQERVSLSSIVEPLARSVCKHTADPVLSAEIVRLFDQLITTCVATKKPPSQPQQYTIVNQAATKHHMLALHDVISVHTREIRRISRDVKIKADLEVLRREKQERDRQISQEREAEAQRLEFQRQTKQHNLRMHMLRMMDEARVLQLERRSQQPALPEPTFEENQELVRLNREAHKRQRRSYQGLCLRLSQSNSELHRQEKELQSREIEFISAMKRKSKLYNEQRKIINDKEKYFQIQLTTFLDSPETQSLFKLYGRFLEHMFRFYCKQAKQTLAGDQNYHQSHLHMKEFVRFGYQSKVVPVMLTSEEMILVYRKTLKATKDDSLMMTFSGFQMALLRVALIAYDKLLDTAKERVSPKRLRNRQQSRVEASVYDEMRSEFMQKWARGSTAPSPLLEMEFKRWLKQQDNLGRGLDQRVKHRQSSQTQDKVNTGTFLKTRELSQRLGRLEQLAKFDPRDERVLRKQLDAQNLSIDLVKSLLDFVGAIPGEDVTVAAIDEVLNRQRIENQGQRPQMTIKRIMLPRIREAAAVQEHNPVK